MFTDFYYLLRKKKVPVSITEWMTLMEALSQGLAYNLDDFYYLARATLVKSETYFDQYDVAFQEYFKGIEGPADISEKILEWLKDPINRSNLTEEERALFDKMDLDELLREFEKRLAEQTEQHDGGNYWIGRGGTSPFGHSGSHPAGIRIGGQSRGRGAIQIAQERRFRNYRSDLTLDVRQVKIALRRVRQLSRIGTEDELDLERTIDATAKNAGDIELLWTRSRKNAVKLLLLMDVGGSMEPFAELCSLLFSAAHTSSHFKDFQYYYFHNCIYENVYRDVETQEEVATDHLLRTLEPDYKVILVGDARMAITELTERYGAIYYYQRNDIPGVLWLKRIADHFTHCIWLNPEGGSFWNHPTVSMVSKMFPMYELNIDGIGDGVRKLVSKR
ncbi:MAG: VWA containing CoxE family protein [Chloroflexi bacterium RBG_13_53_26]|nr:MAG: VWA containing CoxE family protein [Chloroflexi bacterium RBG_13_53_26]